ncbi:MAG: alpha/beta fold hydrolase [Candidatus Hydrogenedens sp.]|nr:alpha/beta fold hydrolase [Candidatus Hydrogenedens sp.]
MGSDPQPVKRSMLRRAWLWRPLIAYAVMFFIMGALFYSYAANGYVVAYEQKAPRDPETGIMHGFEPIVYNEDRTDRAILFVHGFIGAPNNYGTLPKAAADAGWRVEAMLLPGYGTTPHAMEKIQYEDYHDALVEHFNVLRAECKVAVLMGHSLGGALSTLAAAELHPDGLILAGPYFGLTPYPALDRAMYYGARATAPVLRWLPTGDAPINDPSYAGGSSRYDWVASAAGVVAMQVCRRVHDTEPWNAIDCPLLLIHSKGDKVTNPAMSAEVFPKFASEDKELFWLERSNHVYFWDYDAEAVNTKVLEFLERWQ